MIPRLPTPALRAIPIVAVALLLAAPAAVGADRPVVTVETDTEGDSIRVLLTHSKYVTRVVMKLDDGLELVYAEPVTLEPAEGQIDGALLTGWRQRGKRRIFLSTGPAFQHYEVFELKNPDRLVLDLRGTAPVAGSDAGTAPGDTADPPSGLVHSTPPSRIERRKRNRTVIVLDPGHGGSEQGAAGPGGLLEKDVALDLAERLKQVLQQNRSVSVVLTRDEDRQLDLDERTAVANHNQADLFVSIHLNSSPRRSAVGAETYYLSTEATDDEARTLAALENRSYGGGGSSGDGDLDLILWDLAQNRYQSQSSALAESIQKHLNELTGTRDRGVRQAPFRVLMGATMPAVLVEVGFISNPDEESRFRGLSYRNRVVEALAAAVEEFLDTNDRLVSPGSKVGGEP